ncbi:(R)-phenoxypropionate/alpha-ketoglutarate-dioxygenase [Cercospora zeina]
MIATTTRNHVCGLLRHSSSSALQTWRRALSSTTTAGVNGCRDATHPLVVKRLAGACGAEISGVDLAKDLSDPNVVQAVRHAFLEHSVIFFHGQAHLTRLDFLAFSKHFGTPVKYPMVSGLADHPEIIEVLKRENEKNNFGGVWHSDTTYLDQPPMATMLIARELPPYGGDTCFANQYLAYETLSDGLKKTLEGLRGVSSSAKADVSKTREDRIKEDANGSAGKDLESAHPAVRTHPETGRKALYINVAHTTRFDGWTEEESKPLLDYLCQHQVKLEFTYRFNWKVGSVAFWDNRCVQHNPVNDYHGFKRSMHRITLAGDTPR